MKKIAAYGAARAKEKAASYAAHREEISAKNAAHPEVGRLNCARRRARKANAPRNDLTGAQIKTARAVAHGRCWYCQKKRKHLTMDHITPISNGDSNTLQNIIYVCRKCNSEKHTGPAPVLVQPLML